MWATPEILFSVAPSLPSEWDQTAQPPCKWWFPLLMSSLCSSPSSSKRAFAIRLAPWSTYPALLDELHWNQVSYPVAQHVFIFLRISFEARLDAILPCCLSHPPPFQVTYNTYIHPNVFSLLPTYSCLFYLARSFRLGSRFGTAGGVIQIAQQNRKINAVSLLVFTVGKGHLQTVRES